jgi:chemotaxis protein histidine kinase CheA
MVHLVRNSVGHGVETPEERQEKGKAPAGKITISLEENGESWVIRIADDGRGIDARVIAQIALEKGVVSEDELKDWDDNKICELIFAPGFSTKKEADAISGRGVGLDFVKTKLRELGGDVAIDSRPGEGTSFILTLPISGETTESALCC